TCLDNILAPGNPSHPYWNRRIPCCCEMYSGCSSCPCCCPMTGSSTVKIDHRCHWIATSRRIGRPTGHYCPRRHHLFHLCYPDRLVQCRPIPAARIWSQQPTSERKLIYA